MPKLTSAPTPANFAKTWTAGFAKAVRDAAGKDGRLSRNEASKIAARGDALAVYGDNAVNYLEATGQQSVSVNKLIGKGHNYALAIGNKLAGKGNRISLSEARGMPDDLRGDFFALRGKTDPGAATGKLTGAALTAALENAATIEGGEVLTYMSESDYPVLPVAGMLSGGKITAAGVFAQFQGLLADGMYAHVDDLAATHTALRWDAGETATWLADKSTPYEGGDEYTDALAAGFAKVKATLDSNLTGLRAVTIGPKADDGSLKTDAGLYAYFVVGKTADNKLAGVYFGSVET